MAQVFFLSCAMESDEITKQRQYYARTAAHYDTTFCFDKVDEHYIALALLVGLLEHYGVSTLLDVGCGTGRAIVYLRSRCNKIVFTGVEPVEELRNEAMKKGLDAEHILEGDATKLAFSDNQFDCVSMFGVLHHIPTPEKAIEEGLRVAKKMIFISDHNIYGMGSRATKLLKQGFRDLGLRKLLAFLLTRGKGYHDTGWDGVFYPFSIIDHLPLIRRNVNSVHCYPIKTPALNLYRDSSHIAVLGIK